MFQGGENPEGHLTSLQESQATGYPTDVPTKSYDFQAPLSEFGQERSSFRKLKVFHYFLNEFGSDLARMSAHAPTSTPKSTDDLSVLRASVRSDGQHGFLFVNNYVRGAMMPVRKDTKFRVLLPKSDLRIPESPVEIPSGAYFMWPFNLNLGNSTLKYATAQLFTRIKTHNGEAYVFEQIPGISAEFVINNDLGLTVQADGALVRKRGESILVSGIPTGLDHGIRIRRGKGIEVRLILLSKQEAEDAWKTGLDGSMHLVETEQDFFTDERSFVLLSEGDSRCEFTLFPSVNHALKLRGGDLKPQARGETTHFTASVPEVKTKLQIEKVTEAGQVPPVKFGPPLSWRPQGVAMAPNDGDFKLAAAWTISIPHNLQSGTIGNLFLNIAYTGDVARLTANGNLLDDNFNNGLPWTVGLQRFIATGDDGPLELSILPLRRNAPIFLEKRFWPNFQGKSQLDDLKSATLIPQYRFEIETEAK
jgi:hypothetical protein